MIFQDILKIVYDSSGVYDITDLIQDVIKESGIQTGICQVFSSSSKSSILIGDTADKATQDSTADFMAQLAPRDESVMKQIAKDIKNIPESLRHITLQTSLSLPIRNSKAGIGVWQGIYLVEQSNTKRYRNLTVTMMGE